MFLVTDWFVVLQYFSVKMMEGIIATSYSAGEKFYIDPAKLLPLSRFLTQPKYVSMPFVIVFFKPLLINFF